MTTFIFPPPPPCRGGRRRRLGRQRFRVRRGADPGPPRQPRPRAAGGKQAQYAARRLAAAGQPRPNALHVGQPWSLLSRGRFALRTTVSEPGRTPPIRSV